MMFSRAKRFSIQGKNAKSTENETPKPSKQVLSSALKPKPKPGQIRSQANDDATSISSSVHSVKSCATPKPVPATPFTKPLSSIKKPLSSAKKTTDLKSSAPVVKRKLTDEIIKSQEIEIRNKDQAIADYNNQIEDLKNQLAKLQTQLKENDDQEKNNEVSSSNGKQEHVNKINDLKSVVKSLERQCSILEEDLSAKQVELSSLEAVIGIRDSLCKDLQDKLTNMETNLEETKQRLEMVKGHHALALEANESIRREYKAELETMKFKQEEEKQAILNKSKSDQEAIRTKYSNQIEAIKEKLTKEKDDIVEVLKQEIKIKESEMKAKIEQINEATTEKMKLCEIQYEERFQSIQDHWSLQEERLLHLEKECDELKYTLSTTEEKNFTIETELINLKKQNEVLHSEKTNLIHNIEDLKEEFKKKYIEFDNSINKLTVEVEKALKEKLMYETSLNVTRDIVQVLTTRLRESDNELEQLEDQINELTCTNSTLSNELKTYKDFVCNSMTECNEYKEALMNILESKAVLTKEHNRIMEHNVTLIESLQNVEIEAFRELGSIKNEYIEDFEMMKKESKTQIEQLRDEVEKKRALCELAKEHASLATNAAEQSRVLLAQAADEIGRLETENQCLLKQIQDQQSIVVELSLLRQENEELAMTVAKQNSIIDKMKKDKEQPTLKSPSTMRKIIKVGKENAQVVVSPLRERNY